MIGMYKSPITIIESTIDSITKSIIKQKDDAIFAEIQHSFGVDMDKDELIRVLQYDRNQYEKGYMDGKAAAMDELIRCKDCKHYDNSEGICWCHLNSKFFPGGVDWHRFPEDGFCSYGEREDND